MTRRSHPTPISTLAICMIVASLVMAPEPIALAAGPDKPLIDSTSSAQDAQQSSTVSQEPSPDSSAEGQDPDAPVKPSEPTNPDEEQEDPEEPQPPAYDPISYEVPVSVTVNNGGTLQEADVTAKLIDQGICVGEAANSTEGTIALPALTFDAPGTYSYKLELTAKDRPGFSLAKPSLTLDVTAKDEDGALRVVSLSCDGSPVSAVRIDCEWNEPAGTWSLDSQGWHYTTYDGTRVANATRVIDGRAYRFNAQGTMVTGWFLDGAVWRYYGGQGTAHDGAMRKHSWLWDGAWYWLDDNGAMKTGWFQDGDYWYYCDGSGAMAHNEWIGSWWVNGSGAWDPSLPASGKTGWQNPSNYYQVSSYGVRFPGAGHGYYVTVPTIRADATREQCISAFLARARNYLGTPYRWNYSDAPGVGVDCIGLVYQCAYATGMDLGEFNPYNHWITGPHGWHSHDANNFWSYGKIQKIAFECRAPGDLIFWPGHVAIYIGNDQVIEAVPGHVRQASIRASGANYLGVGRLYV